MQNAAFAELALDWAYVPLPVEEACVGAAIEGLRALGFAGANVTIPHKSAVLEYCDIVEPAAQRSGSANTLIVNDGAIVATSTDGEGVAGGLQVDSSHCLVLGAGGASRPVVVALADAGAARVVLAARRGEAAKQLAGELSKLDTDCEIVADAEWPPTVQADVVVNATPIKDDVIVGLSREQQLVDLAYRTDGKPTALVAAARAAGCSRVVDGFEFLVRQGAASFERWTGRPAPIEAMRAAVGGQRIESDGG
jgi:shikimate dehydrogenase